MIFQIGFVALIAFGMGWWFGASSTIKRHVPLATLFADAASTSAAEYEKPRPVREDVTRISAAVLAILLLLFFAAAGIYVAVETL